MPRSLAALALATLAVAGFPLVAGEEDGSDPRAVEIARHVLERLGGQEGWDATRFVRWKFFGGRQHYLDRQTGDVRIEMPERRNEDGTVERPALLVLMNHRTRQGRVWADGEEVVDADKLAEYLALAHEVWINDSYWMFMPYKLLDPGVKLAYAGERELEDGRVADVLDMTFGEGVGYTPQNRYLVFVARDSGLIEQWSFYADAADAEPRFTLPWAGWKRFGRIWLATDHGQGKDWEIAVEDEMPRSLFAE